MAEAPDAQFVAEDAVYIYHKKFMVCDNLDEGSIDDDEQVDCLFNQQQRFFTENEARVTSHLHCNYIRWMEYIKGR